MPHARGFGGSLDFLLELLDPFLYDDLRYLRNDLASHLADDLRSDRRDHPTGDTIDLLVR